MSATRSADHIGRVLGDRYRLVAPIGTGASAHVFLADDVRLRRRVAVKILHPALAGDESFLKRFRAEARAAAALNHPHVLAVYDWGEEDDGPYLVSEYLGGGSLRSILDRGHHLSPSQALLVGLEAARGLDYAHRRGLVHRDVKPANLLFDDDGRLRIADFGLARALAEAAWTEPAGAVLGTARYASPEQARGSVLDGRADVYSLAVVLIEAVTGTVPFAAETTVATLLSRLDRPLEAPPELGPLGPVIARAGRPDAGERLDAAGLAAALGAAAAELPSPAPLPLAGAAAFDEGTPIAAHDATEIGPLGVVAPPVTVAAGALTVDPDATRLDLPSEPTRAAPLLRPASRDDVVLSPAAGRRRRWPVTILVLLVLAAVAGAAAFVVASTRTPTHLVPTVVDRSAEEAAATLGRLRLKTRTEPMYSDDRERGIVLSQVPSPGTRVAERTTVLLTVSDGPAPTPVPDLAGLTQPEATTKLTDVGHQVGAVTRRADEEVPVGRVLDWSLKGESPPKGAVVDLVLSSGPEKRVVPDDLLGKIFDEVRDALGGLGLTAVRADAYSNLETDRDKVVSLDPAPGARVDRGTKVVVSVSQGQPFVPDTKGMTVDAAADLLQASGLQLGQAFGPKGGKVFASVPEFGLKTKPGTKVDVYLKI